LTRALHSFTHRALADIYVGVNKVPIFAEEEEEEEEEEADAGDDSDAEDEE